MYLRSFVLSLQRGWRRLPRAVLCDPPSRPWLCRRDRGCRVRLKLPHALYYIISLKRSQIEARFFFFDEVVGGAPRPSRATPSSSACACRPSRIGAMYRCRQPGMTVAGSRPHTRFFFRMFFFGAKCSFLHALPYDLFCDRK